MTQSTGANCCAPYLKLYHVHTLFRFIFAHSIDATCWRKLLCAILKVLSCASLICALFSLILLAQSIGANCCAPYLKLYHVHTLFRFIFAHSMTQSTGANCCAPYLKLYPLHALFSSIFAHFFDAIYWRKLLCAILKTLSCASLICALFSLILLTQSIGANCCVPYLKLYPVHPFSRIIFAHFIDAIYWRKLLCTIFKTLSMHPLFRIVFAHSIEAIYWRKHLCAIFRTLSCASPISLYFRSFYWRNLQG